MILFIKSLIKGVKDQILEKESKDFWPLGKIIFQNRF